jgi:hypothetical protein
LTVTDEQSFREAWEEFRHASFGGKLKAAAALLLVLPFLAVVFLIGFFLFGGWTIFGDRIPDWVERLLTFLVFVLVAWTWLKPVFDRWERERR